jgi:hypothetical protein
MTRVALGLSLALIVSSCATTPQGKAVQGTAVGGGLVAIGSVGVATTAVTAGSIFIEDRRIADELVEVFLWGALVNVGILSTGIITMWFYSGDLPGEPPPEPQAPVFRRPRPPSSPSTGLPGVD